MSGIQQGRAVGNPRPKRPKSYAKTAKMYDEVFTSRSLVAEDTKAWKPKYSRITRKVVNTKNATPKKRSY